MGHRCPPLIREAAALLLLATTAAAHDRGKAGPPSTGELFAPKTWAGRWELRIEYRDRSSGQRNAVDETTGVICPGDRFGLSSYVAKREGHAGRAHHRRKAASGMQSSCEGAARRDGFELSCASRFRLAGCRVDARLRLDLRKHEGSLAGSGEWRVTDTAGDCEAVLQHASRGETIEIAGARVGSDLTGCAAASQSMVEKLVSHPALMALLPRPIADLVARVEGRAVELSWDAIPEAATYEVYRAVPDRQFSRIAFLPAHRGTRFRDESPRAGQPYRYVVRWLDADGRPSPASDEAAATTSIR